MLRHVGVRLLCSLRQNSRPSLDCRLVSERGLIGGAVVLEWRLVRHLELDRTKANSAINTDQTDAF